MWHGGVPLCLAGEAQHLSSQSVKRCQLSLTCITYMYDTHHSEIINFHPPSIRSPLDEHHWQMAVREAQASQRDLGAVACRPEKVKNRAGQAVLARVRIAMLI